MIAGSLARNFRDPPERVRFTPQSQVAVPKDQAATGAVAPSYDQLCCPDDPHAAHRRIGTVAAVLHSRAIRLGELLVRR
jgi:hypothetical protein